MSDTKQQDTSTSLVPMRPEPMRPAPRAFSLLPSTLGEAMEMAKLIADSDFAPKDYKGKPANVMIAVQMGADVGLKPMQSLQNIAVINGRPSIWGDAALALVQSAAILERFHETIDGDGDKRTATCIIKRHGLPDEIKRTFSVADAKKAGLWTKPGPWQNYPDRMLQMRARGFALRDAASDRLMGLILAEEAMDYPDAIDTTSVVHPSEEPLPDPLLRVPEGMRENVAKAFATLNMSAAQGLVKLNEFVTDPAKAEAQTTELLEWCRNEFSKRQGRPRAEKAADNSKTTKADPTATTTTAPSTSGMRTFNSPEAMAQAVQDVTAKAESKPEVTQAEVVQAGDIPWGQQGQKKAEEPKPGGWSF